ncbi:MAG: uroporphyrinogen-III C-methyltransferase [Thermomicrobiales bacterium]|nr:MAG: uroporphyrinogen-III C-methyltransferase [Thermomicrobiales bacterium]
MGPRSRKQSLSARPVPARRTAEAGQSTGRTVAYQRRTLIDRRVEFEGINMEMGPVLSIRTPATSEGSSGEVFLVGTGPGDPDLLTIRACRLMQHADVVLYDHLVSEEILNLLPAQIERVYVGKQRNNHALRQEQINQRMVELARAGRKVLRLKGGDPFVFGRGGEEIESLAEAGIRFQVVPGITAALGVAAYAGIPLTHRNHAQACTFVTGQLKDGSMNLDWPALARPNQTVVVYMGLLGLSVLCGKLIENGRSPDTPAAVIQQGTTLAQRVIAGTLSTLPALVNEADLQPPTLIVIGEVVRLREKLNWFKAKRNAS